MNRVGEFEKVSFEQFRIAMDDAFHDIGYTEDELREIWEATPLPVRHHQVGIGLVVAAAHAPARLNAALTKVARLGCPKPPTLSP